MASVSACAGDSVATRWRLNSRLAASSARGSLASVHPPPSSRSAGLAVPRVRLAERLHRGLHLGHVGLVASASSVFAQRVGCEEQERLDRACQSGLDRGRSEALTGRRSAAGRGRRRSAALTAIAPKVPLLLPIGLPALVQLEQREQRDRDRHPVGTAHRILEAEASPR